MIELILAFLLSLLPGHYHTATNDNNNTIITTMDDTGGETGHTPPKLPTRP
ncbi:MAG TPA: hypothetical protein PKE30_02525 [Niabella sp.]|nr:hypothetical protein [Niabella sp.]